MNLLSVTLRNMRVRALSTSLTTISILVGTALLAALWLLIAETDRRYKASTLGFGAIIGPKEGAPLTLVLNAVFNRGASPGVVPLSVYEELHDGRLKKKAAIRYAIPQARGDHYRGFAIVGTTDEMFTRFQRGKDAEGNPRPLRFARGRSFVFGHDELLAFAKDFAERKAGAGNGATSKPAKDEPGHEGHDHSHGTGDWHKPSRWHEAVVGAEVARRLELRTGAVIFPVHGAEGDPDAHVHDEDGCEVVGILESTGTAIDHALYIPLRTFVSMDKHEAIREGQAAEAGSLLLTAIIVDCVTHNGEWQLRYEFQTRRDAQVAWPVWEVRELLVLVGNATDILRVVSYLVIVVAAVSILVALYNTMNERRREIAIMRSLGARRGQIARIILQEALLISVGGAVLGVAACHAAAWALAPAVQRLTSVTVDWANFSVAELWLILAVGGLGGVAGLLPAIKGSLTQVADNLAPTT